MSALATTPLAPKRVAHYHVEISRGNIDFLAASVPGSGAGRKPVVPLPASGLGEPPAGLARHTGTPTDEPAVVPFRAYAAGVS